jgi:hypothetical protein
MLAAETNVDQLGQLIGEKLCELRRFSIEKRITWYRFEFRCRGCSGFGFYVYHFAYCKSPTAGTYKNILWDLLAP